MHHSPQSIILPLILRIIPFVHYHLHKVISRISYMLPTINIFIYSDVNLFPSFLWKEYLRRFLAYFANQLQQTIEERQSQDN